MDCCSLAISHTHYPEWVKYRVSVEVCCCGSHPRQISTEAVLLAWKAGR